jgi:hypothetical protein
MNWAAWFMGLIIGVFISIFIVNRKRIGDWFHGKCYCPKCDNVYYVLSFGSHHDKLCVDCWTKENKQLYKVRGDTYKGVPY